ncbi:uncharacterized protein VTP21DRAFT_10245 [Calcarisporiella thermophila]|uniref:uncharacterized protein n=1 Tax=Calcarisporiella thermophila TaxID=911321 RepID=UPI003741F30C
MPLLNIQLPVDTDKTAKKFLPRYVGPFPVIKKVSPHAYTLDLPFTFRIHPTVNITQLKPFIENPDEFAAREQPPPPPIFRNDSGFLEYDVEKILGVRGRGNKREYFVKWNGYPDEENTWEPLAHLQNARDAIRRFEAARSSNYCGIAYDGGDDVAGRTIQVLPKLSSTNSFDSNI